MMLTRTLLGVFASSVAPAIAHSCQSDVAVGELSLVQRAEGVLLKQPNLAPVAPEAPPLTTRSVSFDVLQFERGDMVSHCESDLALGKPTHSSGHRLVGPEASYGPWNAVDGKDGTRWQSNAETDDLWNNPWLQVDLMQPRTIGRIFTRWDSNFVPDKWFAEGSQDGKEWDQLTWARRLGVNASNTPIMSERMTTPYRYVRVVCEGLHNSNGCSLVDFQVFSLRVVSPECPPTAGAGPQVLCSMCEVYGGAQVSYETQKGKTHRGDFWLIRDKKLDILVQGRYAGTGSRLQEVAISGRLLNFNVLKIGMRGQRLIWNHDSFREADQLEHLKRAAAAKKVELSVWTHDVWDPSYRQSVLKRKVRKLPTTGTATTFWEQETTRAIFVELAGGVTLVVNQLRHHMNIRIQFRDTCEMSERVLGTKRSIASRTLGGNTALGDPVAQKPIYARLTKPKADVSGYCGAPTGAIGDLRAVSMPDSLFAK